MKLTISICFALMLAGSAYAIKCYQCAGCTTPSGLLDCPGASQCMKTTINGVDHWVVGRTCGVSGAEAKCTEVSLTKTTTCIDCNGEVVGSVCGGAETKCTEVSLTKTTTCFCNGEGCNGAGSLKAGTMVATLVVAALAKMLL